MKIRGLFFEATGLFCASLIVAYSVFSLPEKPADVSPTVSASAETVATSDGRGWIDLLLSGKLDKELSNSDIARYSQAFAAQKQADWKAANKILAAVDNSILEPYILYERYLHPGYNSSRNELDSWLAQYHHLPQAYELYRLARSKFPEMAARLQPIQKPRMIAVMGDDIGLASSFKHSKYNPTWKGAIAAYSHGDYNRTAQLLERMLKNRDELSPWKVSAAGFWAWRAYNQLGEPKRAERALRIAASVPHSFYGILAMRQLKQPLTFTEDNLSLTVREADRIKHKPEVRRAMALAQVKRHDLAERELRASYYHMDAEERRIMVKLANYLSLPALQIAVAKRHEMAPNTLSAAKFPIPDWEPIGGFNVDPALIYALVRQESGFRTKAISPAGAMGLMQLMPNTARMMRNRLGDDVIADADDTIRNLTLGQYYVRHLLENPLVDHNVIFMLASYNAGIGRLQQWKKTINYQGDPLLFIERIPYSETRYYVMQVMTNYWMYSEMLGADSPTLASLAYNQWPLYKG